MTTPPEPAAFIPAPIVVKIPPSIVPKPTPMRPGTPKTRRSATPPDARSRSCGCVATSRFQRSINAETNSLSRLQIDDARPQLELAQDARVVGGGDVAPRLPEQRDQGRLDDVGPERTATEI